MAIPVALGILLVAHADSLLQTLPAKRCFLKEIAVKLDDNGFIVSLTPDASFVFAMTANDGSHDVFLVLELTVK